MNPRFYESIVPKSINIFVMQRDFIVCKEEETA